MIVLIVISPTFIKYYFKNIQSYYNSGGIVFGSVALVLTMIHCILNLVTPDGISSPPKCIKILTSKKQPKKQAENMIANGYANLMKETGGKGNPEEITTIAVRFNVVVFVSSYQTLIYLVFRVK